MRDTIIPTLASYGLYPHEYSDVFYISVDDKEKGIAIARDIIYAVVDVKTLLYLSGGSTPKPLYTLLANEEKFSPGAVGLIDERYGEPMHEKSNEKMIHQTGLVRYLQLLNYPYYPILKGKSIEETADAYDQLVRSLLQVYRKSVGILGIGTDGHTAGIASWKKQRAESGVQRVGNIGYPAPLALGSQPGVDRLWNDKYSYVHWFDDVNGTFGKRVTMTFLGLTMLDLYIILVFGADKNDALRKMFDDTYRDEEIPARFFLRPDIAKKTVVITDQTLYNS